mmetsp:Transcript_13406/g.49797  ORF Transcript_13406/g.49797 Transcript_13406/m.49797 type:complete len:328 (+) Transcript_13406:2937-3920(+)
MAALAASAPVLTPDAFSPSSAAASAPPTARVPPILQSKSPSNCTEASRMRQLSSSMPVWSGGSSSDANLVPCDPTSTWPAFLATSRTLSLSSVRPWRMTGRASPMRLENSDPRPGGRKQSSHRTPSRTFSEGFRESAIISSSTPLHRLDPSTSSASESPCADPERMALDSPLFEVSSSQWIRSESGSSPRPRIIAPIDLAATALTSGIASCRTGFNPPTSRSRYGSIDSGRARTCTRLPVIEAACLFCSCPRDFRPRTSSGMQKASDASSTACLNSTARSDTSAGPVNFVGLPRALKSMSEMSRISGFFMTSPMSFRAREPASRTRW